MACQLHWEQQMQTAYTVKMFAKQPTEFMCKNNHDRDYHYNEPFFLPVLHQISIQMQGLQSGVSPILYSYHLSQTNYGLYETFSGGSGNLTHLALLTKSNHRTVDRSFHNIWFRTCRSQASGGVHPIQNDSSSISIDRIFAEQLKNPKPMYHSKFSQAQPKIAQPPQLPGKSWGQVCSDSAVAVLLLQRWRMYSSMRKNTFYNS